MVLRASSALSFPSEAAAACLGPTPAFRASAVVSSRRVPRGRPPLVAAASGEDAGTRTLTGVAFEPFEEVKKELALVPSAPHQSLVRRKYADDCESAVNEQINVEYNVSYAYHSMFAYFDRDNVALKGLAKFFKESSEEEREHAEKLMEYQSKRGGRVKLQSMLMPASEFDDAEKGDALHAMELALSLEKLVNERLLSLHGVATRLNDVQMAAYIEHEFLWEQVEAIKKMAEYVAQLRRVGTGHGVWHFDQMLLHEGDAA
uniref:Ferritin n=1 Tax=Anthurium amnicola TaxID=1678845 RepID=A0A1D1XKB1_9ARAE